MPLSMASLRNVKKVQMLSPVKWQGVARNSQFHAQLPIRVSQVRRQCAEAQHFANQRS